MLQFPIKVEDVVVVVVKAGSAKIAIEAIMALTTNNLLGLLWQKELPWCCQFGVEALVEDVVATEAVEEAAAEVAEVNKHFLLALETGNVQNRTAETQTLPGETTATNAKILSPMALKALMKT